MQKSSIRKVATVMTTLSAALALAACRPTATAAGPEPGTPSTTPTVRTSSLSAATAATAATAHTRLRTCPPTALKVTARQAANRPQGTGTGAAIITFTNTSRTPCTLQGHPTVAGAGNGSPHRNHPLRVTRKGPATPVTLAPHAHAWLKLTFVQVQGEADGYCDSGATPSTYPTLVIGLPNAGSHQVALNDGVFAECDNKVTATGVSGVRPA
ncbi:DUF4232 domain-containing protein [Streptomyces sp. NPDC005423]|uniref:DUF4232 domain-containing protein n=1 Tax=Streptomyces sp. NPDC005423 TaxID=3155343 RepID=UPI0033B304F7